MLYTYLYAGHAVWNLDYDNYFEPRLEDLCALLDPIEWQLVTTNLLSEDRNSGQRYKVLSIAPIIPVNAATAYHATRFSVVSKILEEGLLPSIEERRSTSFPDLNGVIHACLELTTTSDDQIGIDWWSSELSMKSPIKEPRWAVIQVDLERLRGARVYRDTHSWTGVRIDRVERIPPGLLKLIEVRDVS